MAREMVPNSRRCPLFHISTLIFDVESSHLFIMQTLFSFQKVERLEQRWATEWVTEVKGGPAEFIADLADCQLGQNTKWAEWLGQFEPTIRSLNSPEMEHHILARELSTRAPHTYNTSTYTHNQ